MAYCAEISRRNPSCFLFLVDQSGSMSELFKNTGESVARGVADAINRLLQQLIVKCSRAEGVLDYYHVGVIGYGNDGAYPAFSGALAGRELIPISDIQKNPARLEVRTKKVPDGAGGLVEMNVKFPLYFDAKSSGGTPMREAFIKANKIIHDWLSSHPDCFPPVVIHITDGESTDGDPTDEMHQLKTLASSDGNTLLVNIHTSARSSTPISFCGINTSLPDQYSQMLFNAASPLPGYMQQIAREEFGLQIPDDAKAFVLNGSLELIITAIDMGTRASNLLR